jgi:hypothetical protein
MVFWYFFKSFDPFETTIPPKWLKFPDKIFKIFIRKRCNYRIYIVDKVSWCKLEVVSVNTTTDSLAKPQLFLWHFRFIHANQNHFFGWNCSKSLLKFKRLQWKSSESHLRSSSIDLTESSNGFVQRFFKRSIDVTDLLRNSRINRLVDFKSFSAETSSCKFALYKLWFSNTFSWRMVCLANINFTLWAICWNHNHRNLTVKAAKAGNNLSKKMYKLTTGFFLLRHS